MDAVVPDGKLQTMSENKSMYDTSQFSETIAQDTELETHISDPDRLAAVRATALLDSPTEEGFDRLSRLALKFTHAPMALVTFIDSDRQFFKSSIGLPEPWQSTRQSPLTYSFCKHNRIAGQPLVIDDARNNPVFRDNPAIDDLHVIAYLGIPLATNDGYVLGSFCVIDSHPRSWSPEEIRVLEDLAGAVMSEIQLRTEINMRNQAETERNEISQHNSRLLEEINAREHAERTLQETSRFNRRIAEVLPSVLYIHDVPSNRTVYINDTVQTVLGYTPMQVGEMGSRFLATIMHPHDAPRFGMHLMKLARLPDRAIAHFEYRMKAADGTWRWIESRDTVFERAASGDVLRILGTAVDITEAKQSHEALQQQEEHLRTTLESIADGVIVTDPVGGITRMNSTAEMLTGWPANEARGKPLAKVFRIIRADTREWLEDPVTRVLRTGSSVALANGTALISRDGREYFIADSGAPIRRPDGTITGVVLVFRDWTEQYRLQTRIRESEERFRLAQRLSAVGAWEYRIAENRVYWSDAVGPMLGMSPEDSIWNIESVGNFIHPEDYPRWQESVRAAIEEGKEHRLEFRIVQPDGTPRWLATYGNTERDQRGNAKRMIGMVMDITDRKEAEERVKSSLREKEILLQEIYHRTKNNMQVISALLELQAASTENSEVIEIIEESRTRIRTMSLAHEKLYKGKKLSRITMSEYIQDLVNLLAASGGIPAANIETTFDLEDIESLIDVAIPTGLIITELVSNSLKHAFPKGQGGRIHVCFHRCGKGKVELRISDNGVGFPQDFEIARSPTLGIQLVQQIVQHQLHGTLSVTGTEGVQWTICFPETIYRERIKS